MIELVLHFIGTDTDVELALHQESHVAALYDTMEDCRAAQIGVDEDLAFMNQGIVERILAMPGIAHVVFINYCAEPAPEPIA